MTAVTRAADAPRAASAISSSSTRCSCTGRTRGWIRNTSRSRQLDCSWTSMQSFANRLNVTGRCGTERNAQISAVSSGCAVPPNTAISRTRGFLGPVRGLRHRRQAETLPDGPLDDLRRGPGVDRDDVLLAPELLQGRGGLLVIVPQPDGQRLLSVIFPGDKLSAAQVAAAGNLRAVRDQVVVHVAVGAQPAVEHPAAYLGVRQVKLDDAVDVVALQEEFGLAPVPREPVDDEAVVPVVLGQPVPDHRLHQVIADQLARRHHAAHLRAHLGAVLNIPAEDVTHADVHDVQIGREQLALGALAAALHPHDHVLAHVTSLAYAGGCRYPPGPRRPSSRQDRGNSRWPRGPGVRGARAAAAWPLPRTGSGARTTPRAAGPDGRRCRTRPPRNSLASRGNAPTPLPAAARIPSPPRPRAARQRRTPPWSGPADRPGADRRSPRNPGSRRSSAS